MTRLKALELLGFKSFADRTRFDFPEGITAIVGPNGSGKSNVIDAVKWVLGEQSVRSLRGRDMTDVIFAGSSARKPLNAAETLLIFDNTARGLPIDADEVQVGRRVYRSGESEYLINGEVVRLRDVRELFNGTGASAVAYAVIEQGRVDALLVASGKDRRAVFEEAAGITRFRARRAEALRRLERAEQNRQRLADIVGEVAARLETLRHQAARARRWRQLTDRLRALRIDAARRDLAEVDAAVGEVEGSLAALRRRGAAADTVAAEGAAAAAAARSEEQACAPEVDRLQAGLAGERERVAAAVARRQPLRQRTAECAGEQARAEDEWRQAAARHRAAAGAETASAADVRRIEGEIASLGARLEECRRAAAGSHTDVAAAHARLAEIAAAAEDLASRRQRLLIDADRAETLERDARRAAGDCRPRIDAARRRAAAAAEAIDARSGNVSALERRAAETASALADAEAGVRSHGAALDRAWRDLASWQARLEACRERKAVLEEIAARHDGMTESARGLLATAGPDAGIRGVIGESVDVDVAWAGLVDVALGSAAQDVAVESLDRFVAWLEPWLATDDGRRAFAAGGRIGIVSGDGAGEAPGSDAAGPSPEGSAGVVGRLDRLVSREGTASLPPPVALMLAGVWVVESLAIARQLAPLHPTATFLTRDGTASRGGRLEIGSTTATAGFVARRAELRSLAERHDELVSRVADRTESVARHQAALDEANAAVRQLQSRRQHDAESLAEGRADATRLRREHDAAAEALAAAEGALRDAERRAGEALRARDDTGTRLAGLDAEAAALAAARGKAEASIADIDRSRGSLAGEIQRLEILVDAAGERLERAVGEAAARRRDATERRAAVEAAWERVAATAARVADAELDWLAAGAALAEACWRAERAEEALAGLASRVTAARAAATVASAAAEAARHEATALGERTHARELEAGEARHRRARILERIRDEYDIDIDATPTAPPPGGAEGGEPIPSDRADLEAAIEEARRKLSSMQTVNLEALAESEQLAERLAGLEAQLNDVTGAKQSIEELIARIDDESRRLLAETIETVRGHFRDLFERVFGGGQADILLEPGVDVLETAVEILARPPGKEPRSISLLSGGEKTMTCVALLLAIFRSRPSPFCILDEVDAALDEANVDRFVGVLREFPDTQIILVTHRKATMAAADTLYGVTMEEAGVSRRVSVRFDKGPAAARSPSRAAA